MSLVVSTSVLRPCLSPPPPPCPGVSEEDDQPVGEPAADGEEEEEEEAASTSDSDAKDSASPRRAVPRLVLRPSKPLTVTRGSSFIQFVPEDTFRLTVGVDAHQQAPVIGKQWFSWCMFEDMHYKWVLTQMFTEYFVIVALYKLIVVGKQLSCGAYSRTFTTMGPNAGTV